MPPGGVAAREMDFVAPVSVSAEIRMTERKLFSWVASWISQIAQGFAQIFLIETLMF